MTLPLNSRRARCSATGTFFRGFCDTPRAAALRAGATSCSMCPYGPRSTSSLTAPPSGRSCRAADFDAFCRPSPPRATLTRSVSSEAFSEPAAAASPPEAPAPAALLLLLPPRPGTLLGPLLGLGHLSRRGASAGAAGAARGGLGGWSAAMGLGLEAPAGVEGVLQLEDSVPESNGSGHVRYPPSGGRPSDSSSLNSDWLPKSSSSKSPSAKSISSPG
mmetsp:Transcript_113466/g.299655  ORF Transcript_113466/g.299655 Transcript_113466/m.299655 type:complete len:218 (-) Transcript_113466:147-800(-)